VRYQRVIWHHDHEDQPVVLWSEIGDAAAMGTIRLGDQQVPALDAIDADDEFSATAVARGTFGAIWRRATGR
jgi:hypothetical protein